MKFMSFINRLVMLLFISIPGLQAQNSIKNPFTFEKTNLPSQSQFCGVGQPELLSPDIAEGVIDKIFLEKGFKLSKNYLYQEGGGSFILNGYDEEKKVGYLYLNNDNLDNDADIPWDIQDDAPLFDGYGSIVLETDAQRELRYYKSKLSGKDVHELKFDVRYMNKSLMDAEKELFNQIEKSEDLEFLRKASLKLWQQEKKYTLSLDEVKNIIKSSGKEGVFIAVISIYDSKLLFYPDIEAQLEAQIQGIDYEPEMKNNYYLQKDALNYLSTSVEKYIAWAEFKQSQ